MKKRTRFERYQRRMERAALASILCTLGLGGLMWVTLLDTLAMAAW